MRSRPHTTSCWGWWSRDSRPCSTGGRGVEMFNFKLNKERMEAPRDVRRLDPRRGVRESCVTLFVLNTGEDRPPVSTIRPEVILVLCSGVAEPHITFLSPPVSTICFRVSSPGSSTGPVEPFPKYHSPKRNSSISSSTSTSHTSHSSFSGSRLGVRLFFLSPIRFL